MVLAASMALKRSVNVTVSSIVHATVTHKASAMPMCAVGVQVISAPSRRLSSLTAGKGHTAGKLQVEWQRLLWDVGKAM